MLMFQDFEDYSTATAAGGNSVAVVAGDADTDTDTDTDWAITTTSVAGAGGLMVELVSDGFSDEFSFDPMGGDTLWMEGWFRVDQAGSTNRLFEIHGEDALAWCEYSIATERVSCEIQGTAPLDESAFITSFTDVGLERWFHVALLIGGTYAKVWVNGHLEGEVDYDRLGTPWEGIGGVRALFISSITFGGAKADSSQNLLGSFDELLVDVGFWGPRISFDGDWNFDPTAALLDDSQVLLHYTLPEGQGETTADSTSGWVGQIAAYTSWEESTVPATQDEIEETGDTGE